MTADAHPTCCDDPTHAEPYAEYDRSFERLLLAPDPDDSEANERLRRAFHARLTQAG